MMLTRRTALGLLAVARPLSGWQSAPTKLTAGELTLVYEPEIAFIRYLRYGDIEVIRGIYAAVRDRNWGTVTARVSNVKVQSASDSFQISFDVTCKDGPIDFFWRGHVIGEASSKVTFRMEGEARSTFLRNRIGFAVLHPLKGCAGQPCTVKHSSGQTESGKFPLYVSPNQPFKDITSISHQVAPGVTAEVSFEGETFEMEDHRNWTDASYKTYCTPLEKPYPVEVKQGSKITQSVTVSLHGVKSGAKRSSVRPEVAVEMLQGSRSLPRIGLGLALDQPALTQEETTLIGALKPAHLRLDVKPSDTAPLQRAMQEAAAVRAPLEIALHLTDNAESELKQIAELTRSARVARWIIFHQKEPSTNAKWVALARKAFPTAQVGGGTNAYFAELNRGRPEMSALDFVSFSLNPQVHAFDNASLVENVAAQADVIVSARQFAAGKGIVVSPVTLKPRFNPNATSALKPEPPLSDPRQSSLFAAAWTMASIKYLAEGGAQSVTYYETKGPRGVIANGKPFPLYQVIASANELAGGEALQCRSSQPLLVDALVLRKGPKLRMLVANMTAERQSVKPSWPGGDSKVSITRLDPSGRSTVTNGVGTVTLAPHTVIQIDSADE